MLYMAFQICVSVAYATVYPTVFVYTFFVHSEKDNNSVMKRRGHGHLIFLSTITLSY